jgi:hypothetical protein
MSLKHRDVITVHLDDDDRDEEIEVYNWVNLSQPAVVRGAGSIEKFEAEIGAGDSSMDPDYVTKWLAEDLWHEFGIDVDNHGIEAIDVESEEVTVL